MLVFQLTDPCLETGSCRLCTLRCIYSSQQLHAESFDFGQKNPRVDGHFVAGRYVNLEVHSGKVIAFHCKELQLPCFYKRLEASSDRRKRAISENACSIHG